jgi:putative ABC transport system permease protein
LQSSIQTIELSQLLLTFIPVAAVLAIIGHWGLNYKTAIYGMARMLVQLLLIGYFLVYIFAADSHWIVLTVLMVMLLASSWISLRTVDASRTKLFSKAFIAIAIGGCVVLALVSQWVLQLQPWYLPQYIIPLAGMIFANAMNSISLAAERLSAELKHQKSYEQARNTAYQASLIPITNSLFAVGLVSLPGMMTGQILSGVSPFIAARYQIMVMCMMFGATGITSALFLLMTKDDFAANHGKDITKAQEIKND